MDDRAYWTTKLKDAEQELDAATTRTAINAAAKRVMLAKRELKRLRSECRSGAEPAANSRLRP